MPESNMRYPTWRWLLGIAILVIGFLIANRFEISRTDFSLQNATIKTLAGRQQAISERVTRLETSYEYIVEGIRELKKGQKDLIDVMDNRKK